MELTKDMQLTDGRILANVVQSLARVLTLVSLVQFRELNNAGIIINGDAIVRLQMHRLLTLHEDINSNVHQQL
jgi:hypothetical protein